MPPIGWHPTLAQRQRLSDSHKGQVAWNKGVSLKLNDCLATWRRNGGKQTWRTPEVQARMNIAAALGRKNSARWRAAVTTGRKGLKMSSEWRASLSRSHKTESAIAASIKNLPPVTTGAESPNWRGGITPANLLVRGSKRMQDWRKAVFTRDNWTCQHCDKRGGAYLNAHHIFGFAKHPEQRFNVANGLTLCEPCHRGLPR